MKKDTYVYLERIGTGPDLNGYDCYLAEWDGGHWHGILTEALEQIEAGQAFTVKMTVLEMDDDEYRTFCEEKNIDVEE